MSLLNYLYLTGCLKNSVFYCGTNNCLMLMNQHKTKCEQCFSIKFFSRKISLLFKLRLAFYRGYQLLLCIFSQGIILFLRKHPLRLLAACTIFLLLFLNIYPRISLVLNHIVITSVVEFSTKVYSREISQNFRILFLLKCLIVDSRDVDGDFPNLTNNLKCFVSAKKLR